MDGTYDQIGSMGGPAAGATTPWHDRPSVKQRTAVQHLVARLFDQLAPERPPARAHHPAAAVQRLRSPRGCILQAATCAVSVSWFPGADSDTSLGELQVIGWRGVVARPGSANRATGQQAVPLSEAVFQPAVDGDGWAWRGADGAICDTSVLAARCFALVADETAPVE